MKWKRGQNKFKQPQKMEKLAQTYSTRMNKTISKLKVVEQVISNR